MKKLIFVIGFFLLIGNAYTQWEQCNGIYGGTVLSMAVLDSFAFAGTNDDGVYYSTNNGYKWIQTNLKNEQVLSLAVSGSYIFAGTYNNSIYRSTNNGINWSQTILNGYYGNCFAIYGNNLFSGLGCYVYLSTDMGNNWNLVLTTDNYETVYSLAVNGNNVYAGTFAKGVYFSSNNGTNWMQTSLNNKTIRALTTTNSIVFAGAETVYFSTNNGINWTQTSLGNLGIRSLASSGTNIFAGTDNGLYLSTNYGHNWIPTDLYQIQTYSVAINESKIFTGTKRFGVYISTNSGLNWNQTHLNKSSVFAMTNSENFLFAATDKSYCSGFVYKSTDLGSSWIQSSTISESGKSMLAYGGNILLGTIVNGIFISSNNGLNWTQTNLNNKSVLSLASLGNYLFAGTMSNGVYKSTNLGLIWNQTSLTNKTFSAFTSVGNYIFAGTWDSGIFRSSDNGNNWMKINYGLTQKSIESLAASNNIICAGSSDSGIYKSSDFGNSWSHTQLNNGSIYAIVTRGSNIIAGGWGIFVSTDNGINWTQKNDGFESKPPIYSLLIVNNNIYAGSHRYSVWRRSLSEIIGVQNISSEIPDKFSLSQNYPNPFNPATKIKFFISSLSSPHDPGGDRFVTLKVFNILGKEVATLVNEKLKPGEYEAAFEGSNLPSGIYFYSLYAGGKIMDTKKMLMIK